MNYKNIKYNYLNNYLNNIILKKQKNKYILIYLLPENLPVEASKQLRFNLTKSGFITKIVNTKLLKKTLASHNTNPKFLNSILGNVLLATNNSDNSLN